MTLHYSYTNSHKGFIIEQCFKIYECTVKRAFTHQSSSKLRSWWKRSPAPPSTLPCSPWSYQDEHQSWSFMEMHCISDHFSGVLRRTLHQLHLTFGRETW